jgi:hypothetical protein
MEKKIEKKEKENSENCKLKHQETAEKKKNYTQKPMLLYFENNFYRNLA